MSMNGSESSIVPEVPLTRSPPATAPQPPSNVSRAGGDSADLRLPVPVGYTSEASHFKPNPPKELRNVYPPSYHRPTVNTSQPAYKTIPTSVLDTRSPVSLYHPPPSTRTSPHLHFGFLPNHVPPSGQEQQAAHRRQSAPSIPTTSQTTNPRHQHTVMSIDMDHGHSNGPSSSSPSVSSLPPSGLYSFAKTPTTAHHPQENGRDLPRQPGPGPGPVQRVGSALSHSAPSPVQESPPLLAHPLLASGDPVLQRIASACLDRIRPTFDSLLSQSANEIVNALSSMHQETLRMGNKADAKLTELQREHQELLVLFKEKQIDLDRTNKEYNRISQQYKELQEVADPRTCERLKAERDMAKSYSEKMAEERSRFAEENFALKKQVEQLTTEARSNAKEIEQLRSQLEAIQKRDARSEIRDMGTSPERREAPVRSIKEEPGSPPHGETRNSLSQERRAPRRETPSPPSASTVKDEEAPVPHDNLSKPALPPSPHSPSPTPAPITQQAVNAPTASVIMDRTRYQEHVQFERSGESDRSRSRSIASSQSPTIGRPSSSQELPRPPELTEYEPLRRPLEPSIFRPKLPPLANFDERPMSSPVESARPSTLESPTESQIHPWTGRKRSRTDYETTEQEQPLRPTTSSNVPSYSQAPPSSGPPRPPNVKRSSLGFQHQDLLYHNSANENKLICRMCLDRKLSQPVSFPKSASWPDLKDHWVTQHPNDYAVLAKKSSSELIELLQRNHSSMIMLSAKKPRT